MTNLAIILARGGSKGFPGKNLADFGGRPLVAWSIEHALESDSVDAVGLGSDSEEILTVGREMGVDVFRRPAELANDTATVDAAARHAVLAWERAHGKLASVREGVGAVAVLYGNIALRPTDLTDRAMRMLMETGCDSVQSVYRVGKTHPWWMQRLDEQGRMTGYESHRVYRRQDLPPVYMLNGGVIAVTRASLFGEPDSAAEAGEGGPHRFLGKDRRAVVTGEDEVIDIDTPLDLLVAKAILEKRGG